MDVQGKTALVTGAGSGIGRAIAETFVNAGATVLLHDLKPEAQEIASACGSCFIRADLAHQGEVRRLATEAQAQLGHVDIVVNNAGFQHIAPVEDFPEQIWNSMVQVMLTAPFQLTKYLLPGMKAQAWGRIINVASIHGLVASPYKAAYIAAKHGLLGLTKTVALEAAPFGVTVNAICPAYVRTPLVEQQIAEQARTRSISEADVISQVMLEPAAIKRLIEPEEVADLVLFLASTRAGAITGSAYTLDLGWTAR
ncbi:MAG: 3-hydroxybutyrate dehydrogenase [Herpetosiphon sp.]